MTAPSVLMNVPIDVPGVAAGMVKPFRHALSALLSNASAAYCVAGYVRRGGLEMLDEPLTRLSQAGHLWIFTGSNRSQSSADTVRWFHERGRNAESFRIVRPAGWAFPANPFLHAKVWLIYDADLSFVDVIVSSANLTPAGLARSEEVGLHFRMHRGAEIPRVLEAWCSQLASQSRACVPEDFDSEQQIGFDEPFDIRRRAEHPGGETDKPVEHHPPHLGAQRPVTPPSSKPTDGPSGTPGARPPIYRSPREGERALYPSWWPEVLPIPAPPPPALKDYQRELISELDAALGAAGNEFATVLTLPTGAGKTKTAVTWLIERFINQGKNVLWLTHRYELMMQAFRAFEQHRDLVDPRVPVRYSRIDGFYKDPPGNICVASHFTLQRSIEPLELRGRVAYDVVCVDEVHNAGADGYFSVLSDIRGRRREPIPFLGLTATPFRTDSSQRSLMGQLFHSRVCGEHVTFGALVHRGHLAEPRWEFLEMDGRRQRFTAAQIEQMRSETGANDSELADEFSRDRAWNQSVVEKWRDGGKAKWGPTLAFTCNKKHCDAIVRLFQEKKVRAARVDEDTDIADRKQIVQDFRDGRIDVLVNIAIFTEGVDLPDVQTVLVARPTTSPVFYRQMIGRGARKGESGTKTWFNVLDCVDAVWFHDVNDYARTAASEVRAEIKQPRQR